MLQIKRGIGFGGIVVRVAGMVDCVCCFGFLSDFCFLGLRVGDGGSGVCCAVVRARANWTISPSVGSRGETRARSAVLGGFGVCSSEGVGSIVRKGVGNISVVTSLVSLSVSRSACAEGDGERVDDDDDDCGESLPLLSLCFLYLRDMAVQYIIYCLDHVGLNL